MNKNVKRIKEVRSANTEKTQTYLTLKMIIS